MKPFLSAAVLILAGCGATSRSANPYIPPEAMHSPASTLAAAGGLVGMAAGAQMMDPSRSRRTRRWGAAAAAGGAALMGAAILEAIEVAKERKKLRTIHRALRRDLQGSPSPDNPFRPPPPPLPDLPFDFVEERPPGSDDIP